MKDRIRINHSVVPATVAGLLLIITATPAGETEPTSASVPNWDHKLLVQEKMCQICHARPDIGNQFEILRKGPHANAYLSLTTERAKAVAAQMGIEKPQESGKCLKCHSTAYGFTEEKVTNVIDVTAGVTCQTCHGPGKNYMSKSRHAESREIAVMNGMIIPTKANTCSRCHNPSNPTHNNERYTTADGKKVDFDYQQAYEKIKHAVPR